MKRNENNSILIIEDSSETLIVFKRILEKHGYNVFAAEDGKSGMEIINNEQISMVLLDIVLPDTSGYDILKIIKSNSETSDIFVILISSYFKSSDNQSEGLESGADGYLIKPIKSRELAARIDSYMRLKNTIESLKESEARFKKITEKVFDGILIVDKLGMVKFSNPAAVRMFSPKDGSLIEKQFGYPIVVNENAEIDIRLPENTYGSAELRMVDITWEKEDMVLISLRDITERKRYMAELLEAKQKAEEGGKLKSAFLANMSHEIRTPMNSILGFSSLLENPDVTVEKRHKYVKMIKKSGDQLLRIVNDILDIAKIESGQLNIEKKWFEVNEIIQECIERHQASKIRKDKPDVKLTFSPTSLKEEIFLFSDPNRFIQILDNLVNNALKFTSKGSVEIGYSYFKKGKKDLIQFYVKDTGIGLSEDQMEIIFERFRQIENGLFHTGTGLGLSISKGLIQLLGGKVWVESKESKGTTFSFSLPFDGTRSKTVFIDKEQNITEIPDFKNKLVYIAEDDYASFLYLSEIIADTNATVSYAENGKVLIEMLNRRMPDLVLLDINMPMMNGFEVIKHIRKITSDLPVIAQTAYAQKREKKEILDKGCNAFIAKPISQMELLTFMNMFLKND